MATIRKRSWTNRDGSSSTAYVLGYQDRDGRWQRRQYPTRSEANAERVRVEAELARGVHVSDRGSVTVGEAVNRWLADFETLVEKGRRERSTISAYRTLGGNVTGHPIARALLSRLTPPDVADFASWLDVHRSEQQAKRTIGLLRQVLAHGVRVGWCATNAAAEVKIRSRGSRHKRQLELPTKDELRRLVAAAEAHSPRAHALVLVAMLCGLRSSELRGLRRADVGPDELRITQRADRYQTIGAPKSRHGRRTIPLPPGVRRALAVWMLQAPQSELAFPGPQGGILSYMAIWCGMWRDVMTAARLLDARGKPRFGLHTLRHVAVSLWIEQGADPKRVSLWAGHHSVAFTMDCYGHLWARPGSDAVVAAAAERSLLG